MLTNCILSLCRFKYNNYKIYVHNLANFDGIFLLKILGVKLKYYLMKVELSV